MSRRCRRFLACPRVALALVCVALATACKDGTGPGENGGNNNGGNPDTTTPVVTVNEGGVAESVVQNETGLLVERHPECFAGAVKRMYLNAITSAWKKCARALKDCSRRNFWNTAAQRARRCC